MAFNHDINQCGTLDGKTEVQYIEHSILMFGNGGQHMFGIQKQLYEMDLKWEVQNKHSEMNASLQNY